MPPATPAAGVLAEPERPPHLARHFLAEASELHSELLHVAHETGELLAEVHVEPDAVVAGIVIGELLVRGAARFEIGMFGHLDTSSQVLDQNEQFRFAVAELQRGHGAVGAAAGAAEVVAQHAAGMCLDGRVDVLRQRHRDRSVGGVHRQPAVAAVGFLRVGSVGNGIGRRGQRGNLQRDASVGAAHGAAADAGVRRAHAAVGGGDAQPGRLDVAQRDRTIGGGHVHPRTVHGGQVYRAVGGAGAHRAAVVAHVDRAIARAQVQLARQVAHLDTAVAAAQAQARRLRHLHQQAALAGCIGVVEPLLLHAHDRRSAIVRLARVHDKPLAGIARGILAGGDEACRCAAAAARLHLQAGVAQRNLQGRIVFRQWQSNDHGVLLRAASRVASRHRGLRNASCPASGIA